MAKVKVMRLFVFNPEAAFDAQTVSDRTQEKRPTVSRELRNLAVAGLVKKMAKGYVLNKSYPYLTAIEHFLIDASPLTDKEIIKKIARAGVIKMILLSGVFLHDSEARVDLLVVGDHIKKGVLVSAIQSMEAELGRELRYASFETADFQYRYGLYDKLIRDILDFNHIKIVNKLGV
ncbi:MAG: seg [Parcubacteria group bacterium]|nr:seg [Parcubacteria group bacterium]